MENDTPLVGALDIFEKMSFYVQRSCDYGACKSTGIQQEWPCMSGTPWYIENYDHATKGSLQARVLMFKTWTSDMFNVCHDMQHGIRRQRQPQEHGEHIPARSLPGHSKDMNTLTWAKDHDTVDQRRAMCGKAWSQLMLCCCW